jgi:Leucine-rich repeat (LRR) protein
MKLLDLSNRGLIDIVLYPESESESKSETLFCNNNRLTHIKKEWLCKSLKKFVCENNYIRYIEKDTFPESLEELIISSNKIETVANIPTSLTTLRCDFNKLVNLDFIHDDNGLQYISCMHNQISSICNSSSSSSNLKKLYMSGNTLTKIYNLPNQLQEFTCSSNKINILENLPSTLVLLYCASNNIKKIQNLPSSLNFLDLTDNKISKLENLPINLQKLYISKNKITVIENLPSGLVYLEYDTTIISKVDGIHIKCLNFTLKGYRSIKRLQLRMKVRYRRKQCIIVIQRACHNWIWKPRCNDGTIGIRLRLDTRYLL